MDLIEFRRRAHEMTDMIADYLENIERYPVKPSCRPGDVIARLPADIPEKGEPFDPILRDFKDIILPGMTHWQHPSFFAYFPSNSSPESILGEYLAAAMGAQCMSWATSPAATELEERVMGWLRDMIGLTPRFHGVIQDTASTATLAAILTARERKTGYSVNEKGLAAAGLRYAIYGSAECHSSIEKAVKIAGFGRESFRRIPVGEDFAMSVPEFVRAVADDIRNGIVPLAAVAALGTTGSTAVDPISSIADICKKHDIWLHVDAAYAGTAMILPEMRHFMTGAEDADSFVFNPHKWMFTNFDCSAYFIRDREALIRTFEILPEYLRTPEGERVNNYRDWGVQLGRRFRALKLWFVIRSYGVEGLREKIRRHVELARYLRSLVEADPEFEPLAPSPFALVCFRYRPSGMADGDGLNALNEKILNAVNATGKAYLSHTKLAGRYSMRMCVSQTNVEKRHVDAAWNLIKKTAAGIAAR